MKPREARALRLLRESQEEAHEELVKRLRALEKQVAEQRKSQDSLKGWLYKKVSVLAPASEEDQEQRPGDSGALTYRQFVEAARS